jgi:hypothetical protein
MKKTQSVPLSLRRLLFRDGIARQPVRRRQEAEIDAPPMMGGASNPLAMNASAAILSALFPSQRKEED